MEDKTVLIESLIEKTQQYGKTSIELLKLKAVAKSTDAISSMVSIWVVIVPTVFSFILLSVGVAIWIGDLMGKMYYGFFTVAAFFVLVAVVAFLCRNSCVKTPLKNFIVRQFLK